MTGRVVVQDTELCVVQPLVEVEGLEVVRIDVSVLRPSAHRHRFCCPHQASAESIASLASATQRWLTNNQFQ